MEYKGATIDQILQKLAMRTEVRLTRLTEQEIASWTRRKTPKKKPLTTVKTNPVDEQKSDGDQLSNTQTQPSVLNISDQSSNNSTFPASTPTDIKPKKTGIKRKLSTDPLEPKRTKNISRKELSNNVEGDHRIATTTPNNQIHHPNNLQAAVCGNKSSSQEIKNPQFHQNRPTESNTSTPVSERSYQSNSTPAVGDGSEEGYNLLKTQLQNPAQCFKKEMLDDSAQAPKTVEATEKLAGPVQNTPAFGEGISNEVQMKMIEDSFRRLDSYHFVPAVVANIIELSKLFSNAHRVMAEFDFKIKEMAMNPIVSALEKQKSITLLRQNCRNILCLEHANEFTTVYAQVVHSFGISFRWELVILLYCKILQNFYRISTSKDYNFFLKARNLITFLLAAGNYKNDMVFKVLNLPQNLFAALINSTLNALKSDVDSRELNHPSEGDWKDKNSMFKDGEFHSNELANPKTINNNSAQNQYANIVQQKNYMQTVNLMTTQNECNFVQPNTDFKSQNGGIIHKSNPGYPHEPNRIHNLQNQVNTQQKTLQNPHQPAKKQPQAHSRHPQMPVKQSPSQLYNPYSTQQSVYTPVQNNGVQPSNNHQSQPGCVMMPKRSPQSPQPFNNLQGVSQLGYSQLSNQGLPAQNLNSIQSPQQSHLQLPSGRSQSQTQVNLQQSIQGYTQIPNKEIQPQSQGRPNYNVENSFVTNKEEQRYMIQPQQYNSHNTNHPYPLPLPYPVAYHQKQPNYSQTQSAKYDVLEQFIRQQLSPPAQKSPQLIQNIPSAATPNTSLEKNGTESQEMVDKSHQMASNFQNNYSKYTTNYQKDKDSTTSNSPNYNSTYATISSPSMIQTGCPNQQGNLLADGHSPQNQNIRTASIPAQSIIQTSSPALHRNQPIWSNYPQQSQIHGQPTVPYQTMNQSNQVTIERKQSMNSIHYRQNQMNRNSPMQQVRQTVGTTLNRNSSLNFNQSQLHGQGALPNHSINQTGQVTPQGNLTYSQQNQISRNVSIPVQPMIQKSSTSLRNPFSNLNQSQQSQIHWQATVPQQVMNQTGKLTSEGKPSLNSIHPQWNQMNATVPNQFMNQTGQAALQGNSSVTLTHSQQNQMDKPASNLAQSMLQTDRMTPQGNPLTNSTHPQQSQANAAVPIQSTNKTANATPPKENSSANFKIWVRPLSALCNDQSKPVDEVKDSVDDAASVIKMAPESIKLGKEVVLFPSPSKTISVIKPTPSVTIEHFLPEATHQTLANTNNSSPTKLPSMPLITESSPTPIPIGNETQPDWLDIIGLSNGTEAASVRSRLESGVKTEQPTVDETVPPAANTFNMQAENPTEASSEMIEASAEATEALVKSEDPDFLSLFGKCSRNGCTMPATCACSICRKAFYCGTECQQEDWSESHATSCGSVIGM